MLFAKVYVDIQIRAYPDHNLNIYDLDIYDLAKSQTDSLWDQGPTLVKSRSGLPISQIPTNKPHYLKPAVCYFLSNPRYVKFCYQQLTMMHIYYINITHIHLFLLTHNKLTLLDTCHIIGQMRNSNINPSKLVDENISILLTACR